MFSKWLFAGTDEQRITRCAALFGVGLILGPLLGLAVRTWQGLPPLPNGFEKLPAYNPSVISARFPVATVVVSSVLGIVLLVIAVGVARGLPWARPALLRFCAVALALWLVQGTLWVVSALPQARWDLRFMGIGSLIITPIGAIFLWRVVSRLRCGSFGA